MVSEGEIMVADGESMVAKDGKLWGRVREW